MAWESRECSLQLELTNEHANEGMVELKSKKGGWNTVPFLLGSALTANIVLTASTSDIIVYLVQKFSVSDVTAAQISNIINGLTFLAPIAGGLLSDSYLGCFSVIAIFLCVSLLGACMLTLSAMLPPCHHALLSPCTAPTGGQTASLYLAFGLICLGAAGTSYTYVTLGANQLKDQETSQETYVHWYYFVTFLASILGSTILVCIFENVGWVLGYGICVALSFISLLLFLVGKPLYRQERLEGSPFASLARVMVSAIHKQSVVLPNDQQIEYYHGHKGTNMQKLPVLTSTLSFLNKAAFITAGDTNSDGSIAKPWRLCSVQQVEDLKTLLELLPIWSTGIFLSLSIGIQGNLTILQALTMDRSFGPHFKVPAASFQVFWYLSAMIAIPIIDLLFHPVCRKLFGSFRALLSCIGIGHMVNIAGLVITAVVESRRLHALHSLGLGNRPGATVPMSALWLVPQITVSGLGAAMHGPGQLSLYYQEFPVALKNTGTAMLSMTMGLGFYLGSSVLDVVKRTTKWVPDDINKGRLDNVHWLLALLGGINFCAFIFCAKLSRPKNQE